MKTRLRILIILIAVIILSLLVGERTFHIIHFAKSDVTHNQDLPCLQLYFAIKKYAKEYNIPEEYGFAVAYAETGYKGPLHFDYNPAQVSYAGALGPMQIMPATAAHINKHKPTKHQILHDIDYNVKTSFKLIRKLKDRYHDWQIVFGYYNTGYPKVNEYAIKVANKTYKWKTEY